MNKMLISADRTHKRKPINNSGAEENNNRNENSCKGIKSGFEQTEQSVNLCIVGVPGRLGGG